MKRNFTHCLLSVLFTSACSATTTNLPSPLPRVVSAPVDDKAYDYVRDMQSAFEKKFFIERDFKGKECNIHLTMSKEGVIGDEMQAEGYKPLCDAALKAFRSADIPPAPDNETYERFKSVTVDIKP